jgi:hypothetical protein
LPAVRAHVVECRTALNTTHASSVSHVQATSPGLLATSPALLAGRAAGAAPHPHGLAFAEPRVHNWFRVASHSQAMGLLYTVLRFTPCHSYQYVLSVLHCTAITCRPASPMLYQSQRAKLRRRPPEKKAHPSVCSTQQVQKAAHGPPWRLHRAG